MEPETVQSEERRSWERRPRWVDYVVVALAQLGLAFVLDMLRPVFPISDYPITYVLITMLAAYVFGAGPAIVAGMIGFLAFDYYTIAPVHTLWPIAAGQEEWAKVLAFLLGIVVVTIAAVQARKSNRRIQRLADETMSLNARLMEDIARRERAEEALRASEERYRGLVEISPVAIFLNRGNRIVFANQAALELFGATPEQLLGKSPFDVFHPDYHERIRYRISRQLLGEPAPLAEEQIVRVDGTVRDCEVAAAPIMEQDGVAIQVVLHDITERKRAEDEVRKLNAELEQRVAERTAQLDVALVQEKTARFEANAAEARTKSWLELAPDGIMIVTAEGAVKFMNTQACRMFGYEPAELLDRPVETLIPERYRGVHIEHRTGYVAEPRTRPMGAGLDLYGLRKDGTEFPVEIALSPNRTDQGLTVTAIIRDITSRKRAEEEISRLNDNLVRRALELEDSNRELEAFSYSVSHDLRAPLRAIDGFSNALLKHYPDVLDERGKDYLQRVRAAAQRMAQLIDDILGLSRATRAEMHRQAVDLSAVARDTLEDFRKSQPEREVEISVERDLTVNADPHLLRIAMDNLLGNAWKFTRGREVARIEVGSIEQNGERVYFIRDNGAGFNSAYADKLFSPFQRLHSDSEFPGTGIGLALVQRILRRHGGRIWAESAVDQGATFYFTLGD